LKAPANVAAVEPPEPVATTTNTEPKQNQEELEKAPAANEENSSTLQHDSSLVETSVENVAVPPVIPATKPKQPIPSSRAGAPSLLKRGRKRKKTGVEVGISLPSLIQKGHPDQEINHDQDEYAPALEGTTASAGQNKARSRSAQSPTSKTNNNNNNQDLATRDELAIPEDTSGLPSLNSFCSKFRSKRKKKEKTGPATETPIAAVEEILNVASAGPVVQVINGEIVLQESSMVVSGNSRPEEEFPVIEEESHLAVVGASYNSFVSRRAPQHWTVEETSLFYDALRQVGTDFGTMEAYFGQQRTRKQLKRKYQLESTKNPQLIDMALDPSSQKQIGML
jgi:transcription factor TFIIIB component B''